MINKFKFAPILLIFASILGCYKEDNAPDKDIFLSVTNAPDSVTADGVSKLGISVKMSPDALVEKRAVTFTTTKGLFEIENKNTVNVTASNIYSSGIKEVIAMTNLISSTDEGACVVAIKCQNYIRLDTIMFTRSFPDQVDVSVDKLTYKPDNNVELTVNVQLKRLAGRGKVSTGQSINLNVIDITGNPIGIFRNKTLVVDQDGKTINYFSIPPALNYTGQIRIIASANNSYTNTYSDTAIVNVIK